MRIIDRFSSEHDVFLQQLETIDGLRIAAASDETLKAVIHTVAAPLLRHGENEERALFPDLRDELAGPIEVLIEEHHRIHAHLDRIAGDPSRAELEATLVAFAQLLREHIEKEETVLFPAAARVIGDDRLRDMDAMSERVLAGAD